MIKGAEDFVRADIEKDKAFKDYISSRSLDELERKWMEMFGEPMSDEVKEVFSEYASS